VLPGVTVEAASPVLIEKTRTAVTDSNGRYQIVDSASGHVHHHVHAHRIQHVQARRRGSERDVVATRWTPSCASGRSEETITVTGERAVVDTHSLTKQQVLSSDVVDALPSARNYVTLARMVSGTNASGNGANDVGGSLIQDVGGSLTVHGSRPPTSA
jgi:hypothetical protein